MKKQVLRFPLQLGAFLVLAANGTAASSKQAITRPQCSFLSPNRPCLNSDLPGQINAYTKLSFLYWECGERGLDYAVKNRSNQSDSKISVYQPSFKWDPALRLVAGYHLPFDNWMIDLTYSFFFQHTHNHVDDSADTFGRGILSVWTSPKAFLSGNLFARWREARAKWKIRAQFFDLMLRNDLWNGNTLSFQPACGLKLATLQQRYAVSYSGGNTIQLTIDDQETFLSSTVNMNNRSFNIGPAAGCGSRWCLNRRWNLFGTLSGALLASNFHVGRNEFDVSTTAQTIIGSYRNSDHYWTYRPQGTVQLGIQWENCSCNKTSVLHYALSASYEAQYWWKQNMLLRHYDAPIAQSHTQAASQGDLFFQGLTVDLLFDY